MSAKWKEYRLGDLTDWYSGGTPSKKRDEYWNGDIPWISASSMYGSRYSDSKLKITEEGLKAGSKIVPEDTVLLLVRGSSLHQRIPVGISLRPVSFNQDVKGIRIKDNVLKDEILDPWFLLYWLISQQYNLLQMVENTGIGAGKFDTKQLQDLILKVPDKEERELIVATAKSIDDKIELNRCINQTLEQIAQAIFKSWFVDFEPVKAKIAAKENGQDPERAAMCAISGKNDEELNHLPADQLSQLATTASLFPDELVESELGMIPKGWKIFNIGTIAHVIDCLHSKKPKNSGANTGNLFLQLKNIGNDGLLYLHDKFFISDDEYLKWTSRIEVKEGDCVITNVGRVGAVASIPAGVNAAIGRNMTAIRLKKDFPYSAYLSTLLNSNFIKNEIESKTDVGTILNALNVKNIPKLQFLYPKKGILDEFEKIIFPIHKQRGENVAESTLLAITRDTLLPKLLSGEISVADVQTQTQEAI